MPEQEAAAQHGAPAREVGDFLRRRRERIARRWADAGLFRTVFGVSRSAHDDAAVETGRAVVDALASVAAEGRVADPDADGFAAVRDQLARTAAARSRAGLTAGQVSLEVDALRAPADELLVADLSGRPDTFVRECATALAVLMGTLRLVVTETELRARQEIVERQRPELMEASTPVVRLWRGVVAVPLVGTLDGARSQVVTEALLDAVVQQRARFAIIDITGVPTVDSLVAQHLLRTAEAARLLGAECVISGIRPAIAQTIVRLGVDLGSVTTRATLSDALGHALRRLGADVVAPGGTESP
ncbi:hypothetical protein GCM10010145_19620 [Streptomyces ruber]|uniref:STAS domain-containing protein n=2 Tax=Streptomyces TaxID=1883 RepID=A0A918BCE4_9ACTN|nr:STAS domain-containing protein [Streptomyces ruber]GGQ50631.1 hypothetical protein GCM10010145_19620 [Streptomyces ruber]